MKNSKIFISLAVVLLVLVSLGYSQSRETGAVTGLALLEDASPVPGVLVTLNSDVVAGAKQTTITNEEGRYRFVGIQPGIYHVTATLEGFATARQTGIKIHTGKTFSVDLRLKQGEITEEIVVVGKSALVDVKTSSTASIEMTSDYLQNIPNTQTSIDLVNLAPGITSDVAYGASQSTGIAYHMDGLDVSDPDAGTAWVFMDYNIIAEVSISGIGAPAEYGGFTGVVFNSVTKSGGNSFKGYGEILYQGEDWNSSNSDDPDFAAGGVKMYNGHLDLGGPIIKDKLTFFASAFYQREIEALSGTDYDLNYKQPKIFLKLTWQPGKKTRVLAFGEYDAFDGTGRAGNAQTLEEATHNQISPSVVGNISVYHMLSDFTFLEAKVAYFKGYYELVPFSGSDLPGHTDQATGINSINHQYYAYYGRSRFQASVSVTHHADDFMGNHDFKMGAELTAVDQKDQFTYSGGKFYIDYNSAPYLMYEYNGYDYRSTLSTVSVYAQDSWSVTDRLTVNPGVRLDMSRGSVKDVAGTQYKPKPSLAPRIGLTFDVFGDHSTALKAHWGRYYESAYISTFARLSNNKQDYNIYHYENDQFIQDFHFPAGQSRYRMSDDLKQSYMDQLTFGLERQVIKDLSVGATFIYRRNYNQIGAVDIGGQFEKVSYTDSYSNQTFDVYSIDDPENSVFMITNPKKGDYGIVAATPFRRYTGIEFLVNKRFSNKWQFMASYVFSKARGNVDNSSVTGAGTTQLFELPNNQIFADGRLSGDPTHMLKLQGSVVLPFGINLNANFHLITGNTYTMKVKLPDSVDLNRTEVFVEPRGSHRYPTQTNLNLRLEKTFNLGANRRIGLIFDVFNLFNEGFVTEYDEVQPTFETVLTLTRPRAFRAGLRFWF